MNAIPYWGRAQSRLRMALGEDDLSNMLQLAGRIRIAAIDAEELRAANQRTAFLGAVVAE